MCRLLCVQFWHNSGLVCILIFRSLPCLLKVLRQLFRLVLNVLNLSARKFHVLAPLIDGCLNYFWINCPCSLKPGEETFTVILDLKGLGYKNVDVRGWISTFEFLQVSFIIIALSLLSYLWRLWWVWECFIVVQMIRSDRCETKL